MIKTWLFKSAIAAICGVFLLAPQDVRSESLPDAMIAAYKNSNLLAQRRALLRAADENVVQAHATLLPVLNFLGRVNYSDPSVGDRITTTLSISGELTLFDNGVSRHATDSAKENVLSLRGALLQVEQEILLGTVSAYMEMIRAAQSVTLSQNNVRLITRELRAARDRFEVGEITRTDVAIAEARLAASRGSLAASQGELEIARENYKAVVGHYPGNLRWPSNPGLRSKTEAAAKAFAVRNHPRIETAQRDVNAAEANILRAKSAMGLSITAGGSVSFDEDFDHTITGNVTARVPIYRGGTLRSVMRQSIAQRDASRAQLLQAVVDTKSAVGVAWARLAVAMARTQASQRQVRASQVAFEGVREEAKFGSRTTLDVLNAEQDLLDARTSLITAQVDQYVSVYSLYSAMGLLTSEHLNLGIVTYDPVEYYNYATSHLPRRHISKQGAALERVLRSISE